MGHLQATFLQGDSEDEQTPLCLPADRQDSDAILKSGAGQPVSLPEFDGISAFEVCSWQGWACSLCWCKPIFYDCSGVTIPGSQVPGLSMYLSVSMCHGVV